jgi:hypothetical protein
VAPVRSGDAAHSAQRLAEPFWAAAGVRRIVMVKLANQPLGSRPRLTASAERRRHVPPGSQEP